MARDKDDDKKKRFEKFRAKGKDKEDEDDEKEDGDDDDDEKKSFRGRGGTPMNELEKAQRELQETLHEEGGGRKPNVKDAILGFVDTLNRSATQLADMFKAEGMYGESGGGDSDVGNDPDYQNKERKHLAKRKRGASDNSSDNQSYEEQEREQEETIEEAQSDMDGSTIVSGAGRRNAVFHNPGGGQRVDLTDKSARVRDELYRSLADNEDYVQVLEASPALAHLTDVVAEALGDLGARVEQVASQLNTLGKSMATLMRSQAALNKSFVTTGDSGGPATKPGVIARVTDGQGPSGVYSPNGAPQNLNKSDTSDRLGGLRKADIVEKLEAAIADGKAPPEELSRFDAAGLNGLTISDEIRKSYGIPLTQ